MYSPESPDTNDTGVSNLVLEKERKEGYLNDLKIKYEKAMDDSQVAVNKQAMANGTRKSTRSQKRKAECTDCTNKWCEDCNVTRAAKRLRIAGMNVESTEVELRVIQDEIDSGRTEARGESHSEDHDVKQEPEDNFVSIANNNNDADIKEEDVKTEPNDSSYGNPSVGMTNTVKSEPMNDEESSSSESSSDSSSDSENESEAEDTEDSGASNQDYPDAAFDSDSSNDSSNDSESDSATDYSTSDEDSDQEERPVSMSFQHLLNWL